jgi:hypothetical protein
LLVLAAADLAAGDETKEPKKDACSVCGAECDLVRVCRAVEETKKVNKTEFDCECEYFCVPGPSKLCGREETCDDCGNVQCKNIWQPGCAQVRGKNVLKKKSVESEEKVWAWKVEFLCPLCASGCAVEQAPAVVPPPPLPAATPAPPAIDPATPPKTSGRPLSTLPYDYRR